MPRRIGLQRPDERERHYIQEWRLYRKKTQEQAAAAIDGSVASISRIENGKQAYTQDTLAKLATLYEADPISLLMRNPLLPDDEAALTGEDLLIWDKARPGERKMALDVLKKVRGAAQE